MRKKARKEEQRDPYLSPLIKRVNTFTYGTDIVFDVWKLWMENVLENRQEKKEIKKEKRKRVAWRPTVFLKVALHVNCIFTKQFTVTKALLSSDGIPT